MNKTKIEWVKNPDGTQGYTWNPLTGCLNHINGLCKGGGFPCYACRLAHGRLKSLYLANINVPCLWSTKSVFLDMSVIPEYDSQVTDPFYPRLWEGRLTPLHIPRKADSPKKGIFVCDMGELFGDWIPQSWQEQVFNAIKANPDYRFYLLTKQPAQLSKFSPFPDNCYVGVTATDGEMYQRGMIYLAQIEAKVKYMSFEPLLGRVSFFEKPIVGLDWLIIGAQTKPTKMPEISWVREIVEAADKVGTKVFLKNNLEPLLGQDPQSKRFKGYDDENNMLVGLRQEMPNKVVAQQLKGG